MAQKPRHDDDGSMCPLWRKACVRVCHTCELWGHVVGSNPQTGEHMDAWRCAFKMQLYLSMEATRVGRQTVETLDRLRQEVRSSNDEGMANALYGLNEQVRRMMPAGPAALPQQLTES